MYQELYTSHKPSFEGKADFYGNYRPVYPEDFLTDLYRSVPLHRRSIVADIGAGTGQLSIPLAMRGNKVFAIEPSDDMREVFKAYLHRNASAENAARVSTLRGTSDDTGLPDASVDIITASTSAHYFPPESTLKEFNRILKPGGKIAILYCTLDNKSNISSAIKHTLIKHDDAPPATSRGGLTAMINNFIQEKGMKTREKEFFMSYNKEEFHNWVLTHPYISHDERRLAKLNPDIDRLFDERSKDGRILVPFRAVMYTGRLKGQQQELSV